MKGFTRRADDEATVRLIARFYEELGSATVSRSEALRRVQLELIGDERFDHPVYRAPFLLIGSWL